MDYLVKKYLIILLSLISLTGFAKSPKTLQEMTVVLDWLINPDHAPLVMAEQLGFFEEAGLKVNLIPPPDPNNPLRLLFSKQALLAVDYQPQYVMAISQGLPFQQVGTLIQSSLNCIVVLKKSGIQKPEQLGNKKIGYALSGVDTALVKAILAHSGVNPDTVELINIPHGLSQALLTGRVDAITGVMWSFELPKLKAAGFEAIAFHPEDYGIPPYQELIFVALKNQAYDDRIQRFLNAVKKGVDYLNQNPEKSWEIFAKHYPDLNHPSIKETWQTTIPLFAKTPSEVDSSAQQSLAVYLKKYSLEK